jgi:glyoxylase-like metal-dependent hydrolase (beta-lactamase superfamily II)
MKIINLTENSKLYTSNVYLLLGAWNTLDDVTTLVDVGSDPNIINKINNINTGLGKNKIDQVILTHSHSDHAAILSKIKDAFNPRVCAFNSHLKGIDQILRDGDVLRIGDKQFEIFHITAHSYDSICLFGEDEGILFAGDTSFPIEFENAGLTQENKTVLERLQNKDIKTVYSGHGPAHDYTKKKFQLIKKSESDF